MGGFDLDYVCDSEAGGSDCSGDSVSTHSSDANRTIRIYKCNGGGKYARLRGFLILPFGDFATSFCTV